MSSKKKSAEEKEENSENAGNAETENTNDQYLRLLADFQNYKRRTEKEKSDIYAYANEKILSDLIEVIDDFERALSHEDSISGSYVEGMNMIFKNLKGVLEKAGLTEIDALGAGFDPNFHNAVMTIAGSGYESGTVCGVIQKGYKLQNKVIRPSMVQVAE